MGRADGVGLAGLTAVVAGARAWSCGLACTVRDTRGLVHRGSWARVLSDPSPTLEHMYEDARDRRPRGRPLGAVVEALRSTAAVRAAADAVELQALATLVQVRRGQARTEAARRAEVRRRERPGTARRPVVVDLETVDRCTAQEVSVALWLSPVAARARMELALELVADRPATFEALRTGPSTSSGPAASSTPSGPCRASGSARAAPPSADGATATRGDDPARDRRGAARRGRRWSRRRPSTPAACRVLADLRPGRGAGESTPAQLTARLARLVLRAAPAAATDRTADADARRACTLRVLPDGMALLSVTGRLELLGAAFARHRRDRPAPAPGRRSGSPRAQAAARPSAARRRGRSRPGRPGTTPPAPLTRPGSTSCSTPCSPTTPGRASARARSRRRALRIVPGLGPRARVRDGPAGRDRLRRGPRASTGSRVRVRAGSASPRPAARCARAGSTRAGGVSVTLALVAPAGTVLARRRRPRRAPRPRPGPRPRSSAPWPPTPPGSAGPATPPPGSSPAPAPARYRPSAAVADLVRARDARCRFPTCRRRARACDLDHVVRFPDGPTEP